MDFNEAVNVTGSWFSISCSSTGAHDAAVSGGPTSFVLDPAVDFTPGDVCTLTVSAAAVTDQDVIDPPDAMAADFVSSFTVYDACTAAYTPIYSIQGSGLNAAITGTVTTRGVVVGDYEGASPALRGFFIEDLTGDGDPATSDGVFVFEGNANTLNLGDVVYVTGTASDYQNQTQISPSKITKCGTGSVEPTDVMLPFASLTDAERFEGMLVRLPQTLYVTEHYQLGRFGEVLLSSGGRLSQPTNVVLPGDPANELQAQNNLNQILVDDTTQDQNHDPIVFGRNGQPLSASNTVRGGDTATGIVGVMTYTWGGNAASPNAYRVRPVNALNGFINFVGTNERPAGSPDKSGGVRVAGMNLLNFFNTFTGCTNGVGGIAADCRGANNLTEFNRQLPKTVAAIIGTNADVIGLLEMENDGYGADSAIQALVDQLNAATAPGTYAFIDADAATGQVNALGIDGIKVAMLYKPSVVTPIGATAVLNSVEFVNGGDSAARNRPSLAQAFEEVSTGAHFIVDVNHLKSKGSACDVDDALDGQGNCSIVRTNSAITLANWLVTDPTGTGDPDVLIIGDLNSYAMEDPIIAFLNAGYENLIFQFGGLQAYSYVFDGQWGYLDHALSTTSLSPQVAAVADWHINADEPSVLDYNTDFKSADQISSLYAPDEFRIADHDPVLVDFNLVNYPPSVDAGGPYSGNEGDSITLTASGSDPEGTAVTFTWDLDNDGSFETAGQSVAFAALDGLQDYTVTVKAADAFGQFATASVIVHVENVAPILGTISAPTTPVALGTAVNISAAFSDAGVLDTHTGVINWGDGSTSNAAINETNGSGTASGSHQYAEPGVYRVTMTVTDKDGAISNESVFEYVIVFDPSAGFVTGGGWITSPAGAYTIDPTLSGKASFGFVSRYKKGATVPTGNTTFQFHTAGFNFSSTSYEWLVVNQGGTNAQFKGSGTINGEGSYQFMIWAADGNPDTFRIKITAADGTLIYDNGVGQAISGGSIIVHK